MKSVIILLTLLLFSFQLSATTFETSIDSNSNDAEQFVGDHKANLTSSDLELVYDGKEQIIGMRFTNVDIPKNVKITNAYVTFKARSTHSKPLSLKISAEDNGDSAVFEAKVRNLSNRSKTSSIAWNNVEAWSEGSFYNTPNIASAIQSVINRDDWKKGNPLTIFIEKKNKSNKRRAYSHDGGTPAKLTIEYEVNGAVTSNADICYDEPYKEKMSKFSICFNFGGMNCRNVIPIVNTSGTTLDNVNVALTSNGFMSGSFNGSCGVKDDKGTCTKNATLDIGPMSMLGNNVDYTLDTMTENSVLRETYTESTMGIDFTNKKLYSTYTKNGILYNVEVVPCGDAVGVPILNVDDSQASISPTPQIMTFTVHVDPVATKADSTVHYYTQDGTAHAGTDYTAVDDTLRIPSGVSQVTIKVNILANAKGKFYLILDKPFNAGVDDGNATGTISKALICQNYESNEDDTSPGAIVKNMHNIDKNTTACIFGESINDDQDYYYFTVQADGFLDVHGTSTNKPTPHHYRLRVSTSNKLAYYSDNTEDHNVSHIPLHKGDNVYLWAKESGDDLDKYRLDFNFTLSNKVPGDREFTIRNPKDTRNIKGNFIVGGNVNLCASDGKNEKPWNGQCIQSFSNTIPSKFVDIDNDNATVNSSSFELNVPNGSKVVWAGLYWQGVVHNSDLDEDFMNYQTVKDAETFNHNKGIDLSADNNGHGTYGAEKVKFKVPGNNQPYVEVSADQLDFADLGYSGFKDVTSMIDVNHPNGTYTVADIKAHQGTEKAHGNYAGWSLVVIYNNPAEKLRNISLFDGYATITSSYKKDLHLDGFLTPSHTPINSRISYFTMDGDDGDNNLYITNESGQVTDVKDPSHPSHALFDSSIEGVNNRTPNVPSLRMDLDMIELDDVLGPNNTQATLQPRSGGDRYTPSFFIISTELYEPRVCYYIDTIKDAQNTIIFENKHFVKPVESDKKYTFDLWISNMKKSESDPDLETARLTQVYMNMHNFSYTRNSTRIKNIGDSQLISKTDFQSDDIADYDDNVSTWRVGENASRTQGGVLKPAANFNDDDKKAFVQFNGALKIDKTTSNIDLNDFLNFKASFQTDTITIGKDNAQAIAQCQDFNASSSVATPPSGLFNAVKTDAHGFYDPAHVNDPNYKTYNALPTQVSNRDFDVKILSLNIDKQTFKNYTGDVNVSIIQTPNYVDGDEATNQALCNSATDLNIPQTVSFSNERAKNLTVHNIDYAIKNASIRIAYNLNTPEVKYACSRDFFAIRPNKFALATPAGEDVEILTSAQDYNLSLIAQKYSSSSATNGYNVSKINTDDYDLNKTLYMPNGDVNNSLHGDVTFTSNDTPIVNGIGNNAFKVNYNDVAKVNIKLTDKTWAKVDLDNDDTPADCSANGAYICGDINATFIPDHFSITNISLKNSANTYTYLSNDFNVSAKFILTVTAKNKNDDTTQNFDKDSWEHTVKATVKLPHMNGMTENKQEIATATALGFSSGIYTIDSNISQGILFNYQRDKNTTINPFRINGSDTNTSVNAHYTSSANSVDVNGSASASGNATFLYARTHATRQRFQGDTGSFPIFVETYCYEKDTNNLTCNKSLLPNGTSAKSTDDPRWFVNTLHTTAQGRIGTLSQKGGSNHISINSMTGESPVIATIQYDKNRGYPYKATMENNASNWLIYNKYNTGATTNEVAVEFTNDSHSWAGKYETNTTTKQNASNSTNRRIMW
jgi:hypothetical protein